MMEGVPKIYYVDLKQDDPKKATMRKLRDLGIASETSRRSMKVHLILRADSEKFCTKNDRELVIRRGICLIEGSWKRGDLLYGDHGSFERKLPALIAANPVNYGKRSLLSSAEALSALLYITGFKEMAEKIMSKFHWGHTFLEINGNLLEEYAQAQDEDTIHQIEKAYGLDS